MSFSIGHVPSALRRASFAFQLAGMFSSFRAAADTLARSLPVLTLICSSCLGPKPLNLTRTHAPTPRPPFSSTLAFHQ